MALTLHDRIRAIIGSGAGPTGSPHFPAFAAGDVQTLRAILDDGLAQMSGLPDVPGVTAADTFVDTTDHARIRVRWTSPTVTNPGPAVLYLHGGAMVAGSVDLYDPLVRTYVGWTRVPFLSVDYRISPGVRAGTAAFDALAALEWLVAQAPALGVDPNRIAVMGDSAGGGIAAALAVLARDRGVPLARQILIYPMLDDRATPDPHLAAAAEAMFSYEFERTAWAAVLSETPPDAPEVAVAVPARTADLTDVAPAYIEVGELDIFRDSNVAYANRLWRAGVSTELHVHPGYPHAFDILLMGDPAGRRHQDEKIRIIHEI
ncbi:acetyl esterase/lipase [Microbacterium sp. AK009]|uniref:alpha/beta hydrolase n=1 Tax=Microbacterium sp. AK009 TaxID=2723068 RepID=UPI0017A2E61D|nr:alpha/beta hydrolase [Microbacterium sp. AK009]NYF18215.1 acetyl esterase/lipase [Microbacterium sp. AK009]